MTHQLAKELHAIGFRVFEISRDTKRPALKGWQARAAKGDLSHWHGDSAVGIATGDYGNGRWLLVLDIDNKPEKGRDGLAELEKFQFIDGRLPNGPRVRTPSGGLHIYMWSSVPVGNSVGKIAPGIDVRCVGGLVVAPGQMGYSVVSDAPLESLFWF